MAMGSHSLIQVPFCDASASFSALILRFPWLLFQADNMLWEFYIIGLLNK